MIWIAAIKIVWAIAWLDVALMLFGKSALEKKGHHIDYGNTLFRDFALIIACSVSIYFMQKFPL